MRNMMKPSNSASLIVAVLVLSLSSPLVAADVEISVSANPMTAEATTDDAAEYDIVIQNSGDDDALVSLSTQQGNDCNGFTSTLETTTVTVDSGSSETVKLTVSVSDQANGECETTVNAQGQVSGGLPGSPSNDDVTVTTTAGDGGGLYSVSLTTDEQLKTYDGDTTGSDSVTWDVDVENNGEQQANVQLELTSDSDCESDTLDATVDPQVLQLEPEDKETVEVTVDIPDGSSTEAGDHCFILKATVTNDPNAADQAEDNLTLTLKVPERKE